MRSGIAKASAARQDVDPHVALAASSALTVASIDLDEVAGHRLELEVHPPRARLHVAAGDERAVVAPDDAAQGVQRGVRPHQRQTTGPVEIDLERVARPPADRRRRARARGRSRRRPSGRSGRSRCARRRPAAASRDPPAGRRRPDRRRSGRGRPAWRRRPRRGGPAPRRTARRRRCSRAARRRGHGRIGRPRRQPAVRVPVMFEWTVHMNVYCPAVKAGTA